MNINTKLARVTPAAIQPSRYAEVLSRAFMGGRSDKSFPNKNPPASPPKWPQLSINPPIKSPIAKIETTQEISRDLIACIAAPLRLVVTAISAPMSPINAALAPTAL